MISRRAWLHVALIGGAGTLGSRAGGSQSVPSRGRATDTSNLFEMDQSAARSVRLTPRPGASPAMTPEDRDAMEHRLRCQCGCTLDVYTCRTTDFSCRVSPQMHRDVLALVEGGYTEEEILAAFVDTYGEQVLMAPPRTGFNVLAYILPGIALAIGAIVLAGVIRRWQLRSRPTGDTPYLPATDATPDELARLEAAIRDDS